MVEILEDKVELERHFRADAFLSLYQLGDLDDLFWPHTTWYGLRQGATLKAVVLLYEGLALPALLALSRPGDRYLKELLRRIADRLPNEFYAHLSPGLVEVAEERFAVDPHGEYLKMGLIDTARLRTVDTSEVVALGEADEQALQQLYDNSYPGHWFESQMLRSGKYFGIWRQKRLVSVAGTHVYSRRYRVAALGNIATLPDYRGRGLAAAVTVRLCRELLPDVDHVGLNVKSDNRPAGSCYQRLGFRALARYFEQVLIRKGENAS